MTSVRTRFLIVCEGARTEPYYFERFPVSSAYVDVEGEGMNTISLVYRAIELRNERGYTEDTDQVWCVFDKDNFPPENFNSAIELARNEGIYTAYSNQAFELWYLLHFNFCDAAQHRDQYCEKLGIYFDRPYIKNDLRMYSKLKDKQSAAIKHARRLYAQRSNSPANDNPSTTVFQLVEALNAFVK